MARCSAMAAACAAITTWNGSEPGAGGGAGVSPRPRPPGDGASRRTPFDPAQEAPMSAPVKQHLIGPGNLHSAGYTCEMTFPIGRSKHNDDNVGGRRQVQFLHGLHSRLPHRFRFDEWRVVRPLYPRRPIRVDGVARAGRHRAGRRRRGGMEAARRGPWRAAGRGASRGNRRQPKAPASAAKPTSTSTTWASPPSHVQGNYRLTAEPATAMCATSCWISAASPWPALEGPVIGIHPSRRGSPRASAPAAALTPSPKPARRRTPGTTISR